MSARVATSVMDPYAKAFRISLSLHATVAVVLSFAFLFGEVFRPKPAAIFTVMAPPAGLIAGGPATTESVAENSVFPMPQGPKLPSPAPEVSKPVKKTNTASIPEIAKPKPPKPSSEKGNLKKTAPVPKTEKLSYADYVKKYGKPESTSKKVAQPKEAPVKTAPSFEERFASRLNDRLQEQGQATIGTGLGGAAGSGVAGTGIAGATMDADALYTGRVYTYLNSVWEEPKEVGKARLSARVEFVVDEDGNIASMRFTKRSGVGPFDESVEKIFRKVKQVGTPPSRQNYRLSVTFETRES